MSPQTIPKRGNASSGDRTDLEPGTDCGKSNARAEAPGADQTTIVCKTSPDCPAQHDGAQAEKRFTTLQALAALGGYELSCADDCAGPFRISRWNLSIDLPDLAAVADWIEKATGRRAD